MNIVFFGMEGFGSYVFRGYLRDALPLTRQLFKYLMVYARK